MQGHENNPRAMPGYLLIMITKLASTAHFLGDTFSLRSNHDLSSHTLAEGVVFKTVDWFPILELELPVVLLVLCVVGLT